MHASSQSLCIASRLAGIVVAGLVAGGCAQLGGKAEPAPENPVVARVGDREFRLEEVESDLRTQLVQLELDYLKNAYKQKQQRLDYLVNKQLVLDEATRRDMEPGELMQAEVESKAEEQITEEQVREIYDMYKDQLGGQSYEEAKGRVRGMLVQRRADEIRRAYLEELRTMAQVETSLPYPDLPIVDVPDLEKGPAMGPDTAAITIVEFSDFECPFCSKMVEPLRELVASYDGQVRLVYRHFPLNGHSMARPAAEASMCADEQGGFWAYHDLIFEHQRGLSDDKLQELAGTAGLDVDVFRTCLDEGRYAASVEEDFKTGAAAGIQGTPGFFVNGRPIFGAESMDIFRAVIDRELARKQG